MAEEVHSNLIWSDLSILNVLADTRAISATWLRPIQTSCGWTCPSSLYWLPHDTAETDGIKQWGGQHIQPCHSRVAIPCDIWHFLHFTQNGGSSPAGGHSSSVWNAACCTWNGQAEIDKLSRCNCTAMLTHDVFQIRFGQSSSSIWLKWLMHQCLKECSLIWGSFTGEFKRKVPEQTAS